MEDILQQACDGELSAAEAAEALRSLAAQPLGFATIDHQRLERCGSAEVIFAEGKTPDQVAVIASAIIERSGAALITRAGGAHVDALRAKLGDLPMLTDSHQRTLLMGQQPPVENESAIVIVTAGTSDQSVAQEAQVTCAAMGMGAVMINDVGVAGLHRLGAKLDVLRKASVVICIAGMEGALPSVIGGLVDVPVIAVPTSVGYGAAFDGIAALLGMLTSCASGVVVVNIDNGFGAAHAACLMARKMSLATTDGHG